MPSACFHGLKALDTIYGDSKKVPQHNHAELNSALNKTFILTIAMPHEQLAW